ncbi:MAG TPA: ROK family transcriptional regulator [Jatrophihabitantaceae bacterium]|jgi:predicted NBD/HSP70 family sugar kinase
MAAPAARPDAMRRHNLSLVLSQVHRDGALTRAELTARLGLSRSTIGALVSDLAELGLVQESVPSGGTRAGRPSHVVGPNPSGPFVVAVDVDVTHVTTAAIGLGGGVLARHVMQADPARPATPEHVAEQILGSVPTLRELAHMDAAPVCIGVSVPGTVDRHLGTVGFAPNLGWRDAAFGAMLTALSSPHVPVVVGNDADLAVFAEHSRGGGRGCDDLVFLMGRTGVGAGIIVNGAPLRGHDGHAGEIGHNVVDVSGPRCHCGKRGCLETYVGDNALVALAGRRRRRDSDATLVFESARDGDSRACVAVRKVAAALGRAIAGLVNTLNPERVLLGGSFGEVLDMASEDVLAAFDDYVLDAPGETVLLSKPVLGEDSALIGAAEVAFAQLLNDPLGGRALAAR